MLRGARRGSHLDFSRDNDTFGTFHDAFSIGGLSEAFFIRVGATRHLLFDQILAKTGQSYLSMLFLLIDWLRDNTSSANHYAKQPAVLHDPSH